MDTLVKLLSSIKTSNWTTEEKKSVLLKKINQWQKKSLANYQKEFYNTPEKYLRIDEVGDLHIQWFYNRYAALRMLKNMYLFDKAYQLLTERKNFSRRNAFGEMHCDGYLWIEKHPTIQVLVEQRQSYRFIFIKDGNSSFHIRELQYPYNYPVYRRRQLKDISIAGFRKQGFVPYCPSDYNEKRFEGFTYGDDRDEGYILSMGYMIEGMEKTEYADQHTLYAIDSMKFWQIYLDDPSELE